MKPHDTVLRRKPEIRGSQDEVATSDEASINTLQISNNGSRDLTAATETATNSEYYCHRKAKRITHILIEAFQLEHQRHITFHPTAHHLFLHLFQISLTNTATRLPTRPSPATKLPNLPLPPRSQDQPFRHRNPKSRLASCQAYSPRARNQPRLHNTLLLTARQTQCHRLWAKNLRSLQYHTQRFRRQICRASANGRLGC